MANNFEEIEVINGITWKEIVENGDLLNLNTIYKYPLDKEGLIPGEDYPDGELWLGRCVNPNMGSDNVEYNYDIIIFSDYQRDIIGEVVLDEVGNTFNFPGGGTAVYALFYNDPGPGRGKIGYTLVKSTDTISTAFNYAWYPVAIYIEPQEI